MKATIENGLLRIDLCELADAMTPEQSKAFMEYATFNATLCQAVCETVATGECHGGDFAFGENTVERMRLALLPLMPEVARELITELVQQRDTFKKWQEQYRDELWRLQRCWPDPKSIAPDDHRNFDYSRPTRLTPEEVKGIIERFEETHPQPTVTCVLETGT